MLSFIPGNRHIVVYVDHDVDVSDVIEETDDGNVEAIEGDGEAAEGNGKAALHNVPIYEDNDDEPDKEIYDEENDAALEDNHWFQNNVEIPKVPVFVDKKKQKKELVFMEKRKKDEPFIPKGNMNDNLPKESYHLDGFNSPH
ncbi:unnamed protein product [Prunus armeniaca]|nr:hypothetical protein GBA52_020731 [Prunus armeniaca]